MNKTDTKIASDFALFDDIMEEIETQEQQEERLFFVSPTTSSRKDQVIEAIDSNEDYTNIPTNERNSSNITNYEIIKTEPDEDLELDEVPNNTNDISNSSVENMEDDESHHSVKNLDDDSEQEPSNDNTTPRVKFADEYHDDDDTANSPKTVSFALNYDSFRSILDECNKKKANGKSNKKDSISFDIEAVADENKYLISPSREIHRKKRKQKNASDSDNKQCQCKGCPNSIYSQTNFPVLESLFKDHEEPVTRKTTRKKKPRNKKNTKKELENKDNSPKKDRKTKLDSSLKDSGNPILIGWLDAKNKLLKEKQREERRERKIRRKEEKRKELERIRSNQDKNAAKLQDWIDRKKKELHQKKQNISSFLETDQSKPIQHNQMTRPKTATKQKSNNTVERSPKTKANQFTVTKDILAPKKNIRPSTSPSKRSVIQDEKSFDRFRDDYLNEKDTPVGYTSVQLFVDTIVQNAVEELKIKNSVKQARHKRPKTAVVRTNTAIWRPKLSVPINYSTQTQYLEDNPPEQQSKAIKTYDEWLHEKKVRDKKKNKEKLKNDYYDQLEHQVLLDEKERRRIENDESKKRVNTGLRRKKKQNETINQSNKSPDLMVRPEPQGSENNTENKTNFYDKSITGSGNEENPQLNKNYHKNIEDDNGENHYLL